MIKIRISIECEVEKYDMPNTSIIITQHIFCLLFQCAKIAILHARAVVSDIMYVTVM